jgi:HAD superfamily hydrolase (TIGR01509 family)
VIGSIAAVIFDMDGVLVDSEPMHFEATRRVLTPLGIEYTDADNERFFGFTDPEVFRILAGEHGLELREAELVRERTRCIVEMTRASPTPMEGVPDVLHRLVRARYRLALASSSSPDVIAATLDAIGVDDLFEVVVSGLVVGRGKPAPDIFLETARRLGVAPSECLVIEDSRNGLLAAKAAGMSCVAIPCPATRSQDFSEAEYQLERLVELLPLLIR